jgi:hypothetical protein
MRFLWKTLLMLSFFQGLAANLRADVGEIIATARAFREKGDFKKAAAVPISS